MVQNSSRNHRLAPATLAFPPYRHLTTFNAPHGISLMVSRLRWPTITAHSVECGTWLVSAIPCPCLSLKRLRKIYFSSNSNSYLPRPHPCGKHRDDKITTTDVCYADARAQRCMSRLMMRIYIFFTPKRASRHPRRSLVWLKMMLHEYLGSPYASATSYFSRVCME